MQAQASIVTIAAGAATSSSCATEGPTLVGLLLPGAMTGTALTFEASHDGTNWGPVHKDDGTAYSVAVAADRRVPVEPKYFLPWRFVRVVSNAAGPGFEATARTITCLVRTV